MARKRIGPQLVVRVIDASDLVDNGGEYLLSGNVAVPIAIEDNVISAVGGPIHDAVYVVTDSEITSGKYRIQGGAAQAVVDSGNFVSPPRKIGGGRDVTPVYIVSGSFAEEEIVVPTYIDKVLGFSPIAYWPLNETSGTTADNAEGTAARDGTYARNVTTMTTGTGIGDGNTAPNFNGSNDVVDIYSASLNSVFNGAEGTAIIWLKPSAIGIWSDGLSHYFLRVASDSGNNQHYLTKNPSDNLQFGFIHGGTFKAQDLDVSSNADEWHFYALLWSELGDFGRAIQNTTVLADVTGLGVWAGALDVNNCAVGGHRPAAPQWSGQLAHCAIWDVLLSPEQLVDLATI